MYKDEVSIINITASQLANISGNITASCSSMVQYTIEDCSDKGALQAYTASINVLMESLRSQTVLLQQALDKLAEELKK